MVCQNCGNQVPRDALFCSECGARLDEGTVRALSEKKAPAPPANASSYPSFVPPETYAPAPSAAPAPAAPAPKKKRWLLPLIIGLAVLALGAAAFAFWFFGDARAYNQAKALFDQGQYAQAEQSFRALGDYKDSADQVDACRYQQAKASFDRGNYALAQAQFEALGSYSDSAEQVKACRYQQALAAFNAGDLSGAAAIFESLGSYSDSADWLAKCRPSLVGVWDGKVNLADFLGSELGELAPYMGEVNVDLVLELREDNTFTLKLDGTAMMPALKEAFRAYIDDMLAQLGMTASAFEAAYGQSIDDLIDEALEDIDISDLTKTASGTYAESGGKLTLFSSDGGNASGTWDGDTLRLNADEYGYIEFTRR